MAVAWSPYIHYILNGLLVIAAIFFGDWRNWRRYYPTILFFISGDLIYNLISQDYPLWRYHGLPDNHILLSIMIMFVGYSSTTLIYLKYATKGWKAFLLHTLLWIGIYVFIEVILLQFGMMTYFHNWNFGWSILCDFAMFPILRLHFSYPILGWLSYLGAALFSILYFKIPIPVY